MALVTLRLASQRMVCVNTRGYSTPSWMLTLLCLSCPRSPQALSRLGTPPKAWRTSAAGPTSSRSQTQAMTNTMITPSSSHGRTSDLRGCKVSLAPRGLYRQVLATLAPARKGCQAGVSAGHPWLSKTTRASAISQRKPYPRGEQ